MKSVRGLAWGLIGVLLSGCALCGTVLAVPGYDPLMRAEPFPLESVRLLDGPFKHAMDLDGRYLLSLDPDRLLSWYRKEAGLQPKAPPYGGWETQTIAGHSLGHYLSACSMMYAAGGGDRFRERVEYIVDELVLCQQAHGDGYVAGIPGGKAALERMARGEIETKPFDLNGIWVPFYTLHKELAGLLDAHRYCTNARALAVAEALAGWVDGKTAGLSAEQMQQVLACEHGGMVEVLAELYARTGKQRYLQVAERFYHKTVMDGLLEGRDVLPGLHGNTQVPKVIGMGRLYELTGRWQYRVIPEFFWARAVGHHSYVVGGITDGEYFGPPDRLSDRLGQNTCEVCKSYNLLKLTEQLFGWAPRAELADYYERVLYNHILASQHPVSGMMIYYLPLAPGAAKRYSTPEDSFWCCVGTGMENHARYGRFIYYGNAEALWVNLFVPSELRWAQKGLVLRQQTRFPFSDQVRLEFESERPVDLVLYVRVPHWVAGVPDVQINGRITPVSGMAGGYVAIKRRWARGDVVQVRLPMGLRADPMRDRTNRIALLYGPVVLAADLCAENAPLTNVFWGRPPVLVTGGRGPDQWLKPLQGGALEFETVGVGRPGQYRLRPLFLIHDRRYSVYFDLLSEDEWSELWRDWQAEDAARRDVEARTIDAVRIADDESEAAHQFAGAESGTGHHADRPWRHAVRGGWFQYTLRSDPEANLELLVTYWGGERGARAHDIIVDGTRIATQKLDAPKPGRPHNVTYPIPPELTRGKDRLVVRIQAHPENTTGRVFDMRVLRAARQGGGN